MLLRREQNLTKMDQGHPTQMNAIETGGALINRAKGDFFRRTLSLIANSVSVAVVPGTVSRFSGLQSDPYELV